MQALRLLQQYAVPVEVQQLDQMPNGAQLQGILKKQYKHHTVPCIFIDRQVEYINQPYNLTLQPVLAVYKAICMPIMLHIH